MDPLQEFSIWYCVKHDDGCIVEGNDYPDPEQCCFNQNCEMDCHGHFKYTRDHGIFHLELLHSPEWYKSALGGFEQRYFAENILIYDDVGTHVRPDDDHLASTFRGCLN